MRDFKYPLGWGWSPDEPWRAQAHELGPRSGSCHVEPLALMVTAMHAGLQTESPLMFDLLLDCVPVITTSCLFTAGWIQAVAADHEELWLDQLYCLWALIDDCQQVAWRVKEGELPPQEGYEALAWGRNLMGAQMEEFAWLADPGLFRAATEVPLV
jgi:hypothetical protein